MRRRRTDLERAMGLLSPLGEHLGSESEAFARVVDGRRTARWALDWAEVWAHRGVATESDWFYDRLQDDLLAGGPISQVLSMGAWWNGDVDPTDDVGRGDGRGSRLDAGHAGDDPSRVGPILATGPAGGPAHLPSTNEERSPAPGDHQRDRDDRRVGLLDAARPACACQRVHHAIEDPGVALLLQRVAKARSWLWMQRHGGPAAFLVGVNAVAFVQGSGSKRRMGATRWLARGHANLQAPHWVEAMVFPTAARLTVWQTWHGAPTGTAAKLLCVGGEARCGLCGALAGGPRLDEWAADHLLMPAARLPTDDGDDRAAQPPAARSRAQRGPGRMGSP